MAELSDRLQHKLNARGLDADDFEEIVRESETVLEVQQRSRVTNRGEAERMIDELGLTHEVKSGAAMLNEPNRRGFRGD